jgi:hypothetical protein
MTKSLVAAGLLIVVITTGGCRCASPQATRTLGEPRLLVDRDGVNVESQTLDFGTVPMGKRVTATVFLSNVASGPLQVEAFERVGNQPPVKLGEDLVEPNPVFGIAYQRETIAGGSTVELTAFFEPPSDARMLVDHEVRLILRTSTSTKEQVEFTLRGQGIQGECDVPSPIDFGAVARGDTFSYVLTLKNTRAFPTTARVEPIESTQGERAFILSADTPRGEFTIAPMREKPVTILFTPTEARDYFASVRIRASEGCPDRIVRLLGTGVDQVLTWVPGTVNFGYVQPNVTVTQEVTFQNRSFRDVVISNLQGRENGAASVVYKVAAADPLDSTTLTVPKGVRAADNTVKAGEAKATVRFTPTVLGPKEGVLFGAPNLAQQSSISVALRGFGGGPDIEVTPPSVLNIGRIAFFPGQNAAATRRVTLRNVGTSPAVADPAANLKLGQGGGGRPYWRVTPKNAQSSASEICVGLFDASTNTCKDDLPLMGMGAYDPAFGIQASQGRASLDIPIRVAPANVSTGALDGGMGLKEWDVTFFSNDPDEPAVTVTVTAQPVVLPPCNLSVEPTSLQYGVVTPPATKDLDFRICNAAPASQRADICLVTNLDLQAGTDATFTLPGGFVAEKELAPQECMTVVARAWPQGALPANPTNVTGAVSFNVSSPSMSERLVQLKATLAPSCLVIAPSAIDFGTVKQGCASPSKSFLLYNACSTPVEWVGATLASAAGVPAGSPNCPGTMPCPEFAVTAAPVTAGLPSCDPMMPTSPKRCLIQGGAPLTFQIRYDPKGLGVDTGAYRIEVIQGGQPVDYLVPLIGRGDVDGVNTDTFRQDSRPKADILIVVDDSCSMNDKQNSLALNFSSFIKFATQSQVDFQIGITTTDADDNDQCPGCVTGDLKASPIGTKLFTPTLNNLEQEFGATIRVGINGSPIETCMAPAVRALTAPKITEPTKNAGLLRPDAVLAVVCVTDAPDQADQPVSFYLNQLLNIKGVQRPGAFTYNVIGPFLSSPPAGGPCSYDGLGDDGKHVQLVSQTNGVREEICTPNWATALENIGRSAFGYRTSFFLTGVPDLSPPNAMTVTIDGRNLPRDDASGSRAWRYDAASNSVIFEPLYVPEPGQTMTVTYKVRCL